MIGLRQLMIGRADAPGAAFAAPQRFGLGPGIVADPVRRSIVRHGRTIAMEPRVMRLLTYFAARPLQIISKEELREQVWGTHVVDQAIHRAISLLRSALGDTPRNSTVIETIPCQGYRLLVRPAAVDRTSPRLLPERALGLTAAAAGVAALAILVSPGSRSGPAPAPVVVAPQAAAPASPGGPRAANARRQPTPRMAAAAPTSPARESAALSSSISAAPKPPATASATGAPALAPVAPAPRVTVPMEASAPGSQAPAAAKPNSVPAPS